MKISLTVVETNEFRTACGAPGFPGKMPGLSYGIPAIACRTGSQLAKVPGTPCYKCYAKYCHYNHTSVQQAMRHRLHLIETDIPRWTVGFITLLNRLAKRLPKSQLYFRWHDSGDIQSPAHLRAIIKIAIACKRWKFWIPTQEYGIVSDVLSTTPCPKNLVIRLSGRKLLELSDNAATKATATRLGLTTSFVATDDANRTCPAPDQGGKCQDCRKCWNAKVKTVVYGIH